MCAEHKVTGDFVRHVFRRRDAPKVGHANNPTSIYHLLELFFSCNASLLDRCVRTHMETDTRAIVRIYARARARAMGNPPIPITREQLGVLATELSAKRDRQDNPVTSA
jgi:hypothetical protein